MTYSVNKNTLGTTQPYHAIITSTDPHEDKTEKEVEREKSVADVAKKVSPSANQKMLKQPLALKTLGASRVVEQKGQNLSTSAMPPQVRKQISHSLNRSTGHISSSALNRSVCHISDRVPIPPAFDSAVAGLSLSPRGQKPTLSLNGVTLKGASSEPNILVGREKSTTDEKFLDIPRGNLLGNKLNQMQRPRGNSGGEADLYARAFIESATATSGSIEETTKDKFIAHVRLMRRERVGSKDDSDVDSYTNSKELNERIKNMRGEDRNRIQHNLSSSIVLDEAVEDETVKKRASTCLSKSSLKNPQQAAEKLSRCIKSIPDEKHHVIVDYLIQFSNGLTKKKDLHRFNKIILFMFINNKNKCFVYSYLKVSGIDLGDFVRMTLREIIHKNPLKNREETAEKLSQCIQNFPDEQHPIIIECLIQFRNALTKEKDIRHFNKIIALLFLKPENESFICAYRREADIAIDDFAKIIVKEIVQEKSLSLQMLQLMKRLTKRDLDAQKTCALNTLFREPWLSSSVCMQFASIVWKNELKSLGATILEELRDKKASTLCLDGEGNRKRFKHFASSILTRIFSMQVPDALDRMLTTRRAQIANFLRSHYPEEDADLKSLSRPGISEVLCLRLLCPFIINDLVVIQGSDEPEVQERKTLERKVLVSFSKVLQRLANAIPFNDEEFPYARLNPLLAKLAEQYCNFVDPISWKS